MLVLQQWTEVLAASLQQLWYGFANFLPALLGAVVVFVVGLIVAAGLGTLVERIFSTLKIDKFVAKAGVERYFKRAGMSLNVGRFFGRLTYWFMVIAFFLAASDILRFQALSVFLQSVLRFIPQVVVAALIMLATVVVASILRDIVRASVMSAKMHSAKFLSALTWWAIVVFGVSAALTQLGIAVTIINTFMTGVVVMVALAGGIAFGLGGKDYAAHLLERFRDQVENR